MKILVISVHPDDETLGCGGTLLKHRDMGDEIFWLICTKTDINVDYIIEYAQNRILEIDKVSKMCQMKQIYKLDYISTKIHLLDLSDIIISISNIINEVKPEVIYMVNRSDIHSDHRIIATAVFSSTKAFRYPFIKKLLMYECISETEMAPQLIENIFLPNVFSDITGYMEEKLEMMSIYKSEIQITPLPRSLENIKALAKFRGSTVAVDYAEAFMLIRERY